MIEYYAGAENYIQNTKAHIEDEEYGFCYVGATNTIYFLLPNLLQSTAGMTDTQYYYQQAFTCLGFWVNARLNRIGKDRDIERFTCKLAALFLCNRFGITQQRYGMSPQSQQIVQYLDRLQP